METKFCKFCQCEHPLTVEFWSFGKQRTRCKECIKEYSKEYYQKNADKKKEYNKEYRQKNDDKCKEYYQKNAGKAKEYSKEYYQKNADKYKEYVKEYQQKNADKYKEYNKEYITKRLKTDPLFKFKVRCRDLIYGSFKRIGLKKRYHSFDVIGLNPVEFQLHLNQTFLNIYGRPYNKATDKTHIDHIIPISTAKTEADAIRLCHYTNLQLLLASDNMAKHNKLDYRITQTEQSQNPDTSI
jgi:hypothetical protein